VVIGPAETRLICQAWKQVYFFDRCRKSIRRVSQVQDSRREGFEAQVEDAPHILTLYIQDCV